MALTILQYEEFSELQRCVSSLVDALRDRSPEYSRRVHAWVEQVESALQNNHSPAAAQVAAVRAMLIQAGRGIPSPEVTVPGRATAKKLQDAAATLAIQRVSSVVDSVIAERRAVFDEAERVAGHIVTIAHLKGWLTDDAPDKPHHERLQELMSRAARDSDLMTVHAHLASLVGPTDSQIFVDRSLSRL